MKTSNMRIHQGLISKYGVALKMKMLRCVMMMPNFEQWLKALRIKIKRCSDVLLLPCDLRYYSFDFHHCRSQQGCDSDTP